MRIVISMLGHRLYASSVRGTWPHSLPGSGPSLCRCVRAKISAILFHSRNFDRPNEIFRSNSPHGIRRIVSSFSLFLHHSVYINTDILSLFSSFLFCVVSLWLMVHFDRILFFFSSLEKRDLTRLRIESLSWKLWNINVEIRLFFSLYFLSAVLEKYDLRLWALNFYSVCNWKGNKFF